MMRSFASFVPMVFLAACTIGPVVRPASSADPASPQAEEAPQPPGPWLNREDPILARRPPAEGGASPPAGGQGHGGHDHGVPAPGPHSAKEPAASPHAAPPHDHAKEPRLSPKVSPKHDRRDEEVYTCSMHPEVRLSKPGRC